MGKVWKREEEREKTRKGLRDRGGDGTRVEEKRKVGGVGQRQGYNHRDREGARRERKGTDENAIGKKR